MLPASELLLCRMTEHMIIQLRSTGKCRVTCLTLERLHLSMNTACMVGKVGTVVKLSPTDWAKIWLLTCTKKTSDKIHHGQRYKCV